MGWVDYEREPLKKLAIYLKIVRRTWNEISSGHAQDKKIEYSAPTAPPKNEQLGV